MLNKKRRDNKKKQGTPNVKPVYSFVIPCSEFHYSNGSFSGSYI